MRARLHHLTRIIALAAVYVVVARFGLKLDAVQGFATLVWLPTGISLAALVGFGHRLWPGVAIGALVANVLTGAPVAVALGIAAGNTLEALTGAYALRKIPGFTRSLERLEDVLGLVFLAAIASTAISATIGVSSLLLGGIVAPERFGETWRAWWVGDLIADLVVAPVLLVWSAPPRSIQPAPRWPELAALAATVVAFTVLIYGGPPDGEDNASIFGHSYMFFPLLIWASLRFGQRKTITTTFIVTAIAVAGTAMGHGPFVQSSLYRSLFALQTFMAVSAATFLVLGASIAERRQAAHDLGNAVEARNTLISVASHELKTPLTTLQLQLHLITRKFTRGPIDEASITMLGSRVASIDRQVSRLGRLIDNLLDVSRINAGKMQLEYDDVDLVAMVREVVGRFEEELSLGGPPVTVRAGVPVSGRWDRMRLDQIVTNLVSNALKYGKNSPVDITVEPGNDPSTARLEVRDHGIGIAEGDLARIFERFERLVSGKQAGGFGLGLWIVREIVQAMGGTISVWSKPGEGTTFTVELPRKPAAEDADSRRPSPEASLSEPGPGQP
jgi:signal transduction histidine kinase